jgi:hypothetical protein
MQRIIQTIVLLLYAYCVQGIAQTEMTVTEAATKDGKIVLLKSDGTWTYKLEITSKTADEFATVYFYRVKEVSGIDNKNTGINIDDKEIFKMPQNRFLGVKIKAGNHRIKMRQKQSEMLLEVEAGKTYFIRVSETVAGFGYNDSLNEIAAKQAIFQMRDLSVLEDSKIKANEFSYLKEKPQ